ncbi:MAG: hypothetical protein P1U68_11480 [Verrucomicrobiales bacterium]|nr:hypothetical protein [Verrucomicrobiales bacterium]
MNSEDYSREDLLTALHPGVAAASLLLLLALWLISLKLRKRPATPGLFLHLPGFLLISGAIWFGLQFLGKTLSLATSWPLPALAIIGGTAAELIIFLYGFERHLVKPAQGRWLLALRLGALALLILILAQPVRSFLETREIDREIAVLIDQSDSMQLADQRLSSTEKLDRAALFHVAVSSGRPNFRKIEELTTVLKDSINREIAALSSAPDIATGLESRAAQLPAFFEESNEINNTLTESLKELELLNLPDEVKARVDDYLKRSRDGLRRILSKAEEAGANGSGEELLKQLSVANEELAGITNTLTTTYRKADEWFYNSLPASSKKEIDTAAATPRQEIASRILSTNHEWKEQGSVSDPTLLDQLGKDYNIRLYGFANDTIQLSELDDAERDREMASSAGSSQTDLSGALATVLEETSPESLAGVLLLSDGQHNGATLPEDTLRQLALQNTPLSAVPIGGELGPVDISILSLQAPESIYLDDRLVVTAEAKLDGFLGKKVNAQLLTNGSVAEEIEIEVTDINFRTELRFVHRPEKKGILDYQIKLEPDAAEIFQSNNTWDFKVAVTDDRTNVLLVDGFPRWEFRYLRNLFYGRDKSVHLQSVLLDPDEIYRGPQTQSVAASATRPFGDAEATDLPRTEDEWGLFDVIILGDVSPSALHLRDWKAIEDAVTRRGALLVCVAGFRHMPHGHDNETLRNLLPVNYTPGNAVQLTSPESAYRIALTPAGRNHPVTSQSASRALNQDRWNSFQPMRWRFRHDSVKETAEVLAFAQAIGSPGSLGTLASDGSPESVEAAIEQLANRKQMESDGALISTIRAGLGKVLMLNFDQTWRFRYGVGDTYHHRFWGQITRWGAGENLRSGNDLIRLGSDRLSYTPDDPVNVTAKVLDENRRPIVDAHIEVEVWRGEERISTQEMSYRTDSSGIYETSLGSLPEAGEYELKLVGNEVEAALAIFPDGPQELSTELLVVTTRNPVELAELTADRDFLNRATGLTGGKMVELHELDSLLSSFGAPKETLKERRNLTLWDTWPALLSFLGLVTSEWILRRRIGLV